MPYARLAYNTGRIMKKHMFNNWSVGLVLAAAVVQTSMGVDWKQRFDYKLAEGFRMEGYSLVYDANKDLNFFRDFAAVNADGSINTVIEIPQGDNAKFEVSEETGVMSWELKSGVPRLIKYLGYPCNYGMMPRTIGGDGDSLDTLTLGRMELRGTVAQAKVIGVMHLIDGDDIDDKIIAVLPDSPMYGVNNMVELEQQFPGVKTILKTWFENYKGPGSGLVVDSFGDADDAWAVIAAGSAQYQAAQ